MKRDLMPFWQALLRDPRRIGAITPAGRALCSAMVREVLGRPPGLVIELGAGTGAITRGLLEARAQMSGLIAFEKAPELAACLQKKFPGLTIHPGCASAVGQLQLPGENTLTLVSSLPFRSLPSGDRHRLSDAIAKLSAATPHFRLIQYSYFGKLPFPSPAAHLAWRRKHTVMRNLPPATLWVLEKT